MANKTISFDLDDPRIGNLADVLTNKTSRKILDYLADKEVSETEISRDLKLPANTVNYNVKKLLDAGLIEKSKDYFWSVKGKKVPKYRVANKKIVISPKSFGNLKQLAVSFLGIGLVGFFVRQYSGNQNIQIDEKVDTSSIVTESAGLAAEGVRIAEDSAMSTTQMPEVWIWFVVGGIIGLAIYYVAGKFIRS